MGSMSVRVSLNTIFLFFSIFIFDAFAQGGISETNSGWSSSISEANYQSQDVEEDLVEKTHRLIDELKYIGSKISNPQDKVYKLAPEESHLFKELKSGAPTREVFHQLMKRLHIVFNARDFTDREIVNLRPLFDTSLDLLDSIGTKNDTETIRTMFLFLDSKGSSSGRINDLPWISEIRIPRKLRAKVKEVINNCSNRERSFRTLDEAIYLKGGGLQVFEDELRKRIFGQDEVIDRLLEIRENSFLSPHDSFGKLTLMGLPSTGKRRAVEAFVDAIHRDDKAHEEHLMVIEELANAEELWGVLGSTTGHVGSNFQSPLIKWIVKHSGGRYKIETEKSKKGQDQPLEYVTENPSWHPGEVLPGYFDPRDSVLLFNNFHMWAKSAKDGFVESLDSRWFVIKSPNGGISRIQVPVNIFISTKDGMELIVSRDANGARYGKSLDLNQMNANWEVSAKDVDGLVESLILSGDSNSSGANSKGTSEEMARKMKPLVLMKPLMEDSLKSIIKVELGKIEARLRASKHGISNVKFEWSPEMIDVLYSYDFQAEEGAAPMVEKVHEFVQKPIYKGIRSGEIQTEFNHDERVFVDFLANPDNTKSLKLSFLGTQKEVVLPIDFTKKDKFKASLSEERIQQLLDLPNQLKKHVFGAEPVIDKLATAILVNEEEKSHADADGRAQIFAFLGPSSTGKTETSKGLAYEYLGSRDNILLVNFNQIKTPKDMETYFFGSRDSYTNKIVRSEFMRYYDRTKSHVIIVLDEFSNAPEELLKGMYDLFREPEVSTFSDRKPRKMKNVIFIVTGNAGEEWYEKVPGDIPVEMQDKAFQGIYEQAMKDEEAQRKTLRKHFSEALNARLPLHHVFFYSHLSLPNIRRLANLSVTKMFKEMEDREDGWGWRVSMKSKEEYKKLLSYIEEQQFIIRRQGASIVDFVFGELKTNIKATLLKNLVPKGSIVSLTFDDRKLHEAVDFNKEGGQHVYLNMEVKGPNFQEGNMSQYFVPFNIKNKVRSKPKSDNQLIAVGYHEAGHGITKKVLFGNTVDITEVSIHPGVGFFDDQWLVYEGVQKTDQIKNIFYNKEVFLRTIASLLGGTVAQEIITKGKVDDAGKGNDLSQANYYIRRAILSAGVSERWGNHVIPPGMKEEDYIRTLSDSDRKLLKEEVARFLQEAKNIAIKVLTDNFDLLSKLSVQLIENEVVNRQELSNFFSENKFILDINKVDSSSLFEHHTLANFLKGRGVNPEEKGERGIEPVFWDFVKLPSKIKRAEDVVAQMRQQWRESVDVELSPRSYTVPTSKGLLVCSQLFSPSSP